MKYGISLGMFLAIASPAIAQTPERANRTSIESEATSVMHPFAKASLEWDGGGTSKDGIAFCVSSASGRYVLMLDSLTGQGLRGSRSLPYTVRFESNGLTKTGQVSARNPSVRFDGAVSPDRKCEKGPNARIILSLDPNDAQAANAGTYADNVSLTIEPR